MYSQLWLNENLTFLQKKKKEKGEEHLCSLENGYKEPFVLVNNHLEFFFFWSYIPLLKYKTIFMILSSNYKSYLFFNLPLLQYYANVMTKRFY